MGVSTKKGNAKLKRYNITLSGLFIQQVTASEAHHDRHQNGIHGQHHSAWKLNTVNCPFPLANPTHLQVCRPSALVFLQPVTSRKTQLARDSDFSRGLLAVGLLLGPSWTQYLLIRLRKDVQQRILSQRGNTDRQAVRLAIKCHPHAGLYVNEGSSAKLHTHSVIKTIRNPGEG